MFKKATLSLAATISMLAPVAAHANEFENTSVIVNVEDLDLNSVKGQSRLNTRIKSAARAVCSTNGSRSLADKINTTNCMAAAIEAAGQQTAIMIATSKASKSQAINTVAFLNARG
jgi:UrcA family protein